MKVYFLTLGCRVNQYETDAARRLFLDNGHVNAESPEDADVCIVNTCSVASFGAHHGFAAYVDSKHAMMGLTRSMAWELGPEIRCNGIAPGLIHTAMVDSIGGPGVLQNMIDMCPVKRCGEGQDIAELALFLASDECTFLDGQIIKCDGGFEI